MRIACPNCDTSYDVPDQVLRPGRSLRCARCRQEWAPLPGFTPERASGGLEPGAGGAVSETAGMASALADDAIAPTGAAPADRRPPLAAGPPPLAAARSGPRIAVVLSWIASFVLLGTIGWSAIAWRPSIMHAWPPSARIYAVLGYRSL